MNASHQSLADFGELQLDEALRLLRHAGRGAPFAQGVNNPVALQALIDGLCELSSRDGLTGIANHRQFRLVLERELDRVTRTGEPLALLLIDIDHFKQVNDQYGHPVGDAVLKSVAWTLESGVRPMDTVTRYGGEEWAIVLPSSLSAHARGTAERLRRDIERTAVYVMLNQVRTRGEGATLNRQLQQVVDRFLTVGGVEGGALVKLEYLGEIPYDAIVPQAVRSRTLVMESLPGSEVSKAFVVIAGRLMRRLTAAV